MRKEIFFWLGVVLFCGGIYLAWDSLTRYFGVEAGLIFLGAIGVWAGRNLIANHNP